MYRHHMLHDLFTRLYCSSVDAVAAGVAITLTSGVKGLSLLKVTITITTYCYG